MSARARRLTRYARIREAGSCQNCGAEAARGRSRCLPCGQRNAAYARKQWPRRKAARTEETQ